MLLCLLVVFWVEYLQFVQKPAVCVSIRAYAEILGFYYSSFLKLGEYFGKQGPAGLSFKTAQSIVYSS